MSANVRACRRAGILCYISQNGCR